MKEFIEKVIADYPRYIREAALFERHLKARENRDMRDALTLLSIQISTVESWFVLLDTAEKLAFRQALQADQDVPTAIKTVALAWIQKTAKEDRVPWKIRENAIAKIAAFVNAHEAAMRAIFNA